MYPTDGKFETTSQLMGSSVFFTGKQEEHVEKSNMFQTDLKHQVNKSTKPNRTNEKQKKYY